MGHELGARGADPQPARAICVGARMHDGCGVRVVAVRSLLWIASLFLAAVAALEHGKLLKGLEAVRRLATSHGARATHWCESGWGEACSLACTALRVLFFALIVVQLGIHPSAVGGATLVHFISKAGARGDGGE